MALNIDFEKKKKYNYPQSIKEVDLLTGEQFETFIFNYLKEFEGYDGQMTEKDDYGIDIILWKKDNPVNRFGVQCKRYGPKTTLGENDLVKMQKGVKHYGLINPNTGEPNLILFTSATRNQISRRGLAYIENEEIQTFYRDDIIEIIKHLDKELERDITDSNYKNIAFDTSKKKKGSFKENTEFVEMLKKERINIATYNKISPLYLVYTDKTIEDIALKMPASLEELALIKGFNSKKIDLFGKYLINKIKPFINMTTINDEKPIDVDNFEVYLKELRKKIASFNNIKQIYFVFDNNTLSEILQKRPKTIEELSKISGIGPKKIEIWGNFFIEKLNDFYLK